MFEPFKYLLVLVWIIELVGSHLPAERRVHMTEHTPPAHLRTEVKGQAHVMEDEERGMKSEEEEQKQRMR